MKAKSKVQKQSQTERAEQKVLLRNILHAKYELECATQNFSYATDPVLIDMYAYQIKACQAKYHYLLTHAKEKGLTDHGSLLAFSEKR